MNEADPQRRIARLEDLIEALADRKEQCRRLMQIAKLAVGAGFLWAALIAAGFLKLGAVAVLGITILVIGGFVMLGSNSSTAEQTAAQIAAAETERQTLIDGLALQPVETSEPAVVFLPTRE